MRFSDFATKENNWLIKLLLWALFLLFFTLSFFSEGSSGGADTYTRFFITREAWQSPEYFLHFWAKPVYVLLASPFAQFGYTGIKVFNILLGIFSAWAAYRTARNYGIRFRTTVIFLILFAPIYMYLMMSAMTEILFGAFLIAGVWLFSEKKFIASAIVISFIIHVRTEGMAFLIFWAVMYVLNKQYKSIPWLLTGFIVYSIIGSFFVYHDFFWFFTQNIYTGYEVGYGSGPLSYYVKQYDLIFGTYLTVLILIGMLAYLYVLIRSGKEKRFMPAFTEAAFIAGIPLLYFVLHSIFWWKGLFHVLGDVRFMSAIIPLCGIVAIKGLDIVFTKIKSTVIIFFLSVAAIVPSVITPFNVYQFPIPLYDENYELNKAVKWLKSTPYISKNILVYNPFIPFLLERNPYRDSTLSVGIVSAATPDSMKPGDVFIWETHFAGIEGRISFDSLITNVNFELIRTFRPDWDMRVFDGQPYSISIFRKVSDNMKGERKYVNDTLYYQDFENTAIYTDAREVPSSSGNHSLSLNINRIYSPTLDTSMAAFKDDQLMTLYAKVDVYFPGDKKTKVCLVASVEKDLQPSFYKGITFDTEVIPGKNTLEITEQLYLPELKDLRLKVYAYTADSLEVFIDNLTVIKKRPVIEF